MKITQGRNATLILEYDNIRFLIDPIFAPKGTYPPFPSILRANEMNPLHDLPISIEEMTRVDAVIITHLHTDHFDNEAKNLIPKDLPVFVQNNFDKSELITAGANSVYTEQLIMGKEEVKKTHETLPDALLLATHMEGVNHWTLSRQELRNFSIEHGFSEQLYIPFDGESILLNK